MNRESAARGVSSFRQVGDTSLRGNFVSVLSGGDGRCGGGGESVEAFAFSPSHRECPAL